MGYTAPQAQDEIFVDRNVYDAGGPEFRNYVERHEQSHVLANRAKTKGQDRHPLNYRSKGNVDAFAYDLARAIDKNKEALVKKYPVLLHSGYIKNPYEAGLEEIMADLNAIEEVYQTDLLKDPLFKNVWQSSHNVGLYKAASGTRRTRMDARDPEPYNPQGYK